MTGEARRNSGPPVSNGRTFLTAGLVVGCLVLIGHAVFLPPGWLGDMHWLVVLGGGGLAFGAGYWGVGPLSGTGGASAPGIALALRGEVIMYEQGCFTEISEDTICTVGPPNQFQYEEQTLFLAIGFVLAGVAVGYALGASARRAHAWVSEQDRTLF